MNTTRSGGHGPRGWYWLRAWFGLARLEGASTSRARAGIEALGWRQALGAPSTKLRCFLALCLCKRVLSGCFGLLASDADAQPRIFAEELDGPVS